MNFRSMNDIITTQRVPLGGYSDASAVEATASNSEVIQPLYKDYNMEKYTLDGMPEREYEVANFVWASDTAVGADVQVLKFPKALFDKQQLSDLVKNFSLVRAGLRLIIRISATPELFGALQVSWCPDATSDADSNHQLGGVEDGSLFPHVIVSAASGTAAILDIPFVSRFRALNLYSYVDDEIARVVFKVMAPLTRDDLETCKARVIVSAQFLDPAFMLPTSKHNLNASPLNIIEGSLQPPIEYPAEVQSNPRTEAVDKSEGAVSSILDATVTLASAIENVPLIGEYAGLYKDGAKVVSSGLKSLGLCKPNTLNYNTIVRSNPNFDHNLGEGISTATPCGISAENAISTESNLGGVSADEMALSYIVQTPVVIENIDMREMETLSFTIQDEGGGAYVDVVRNMFDYASGSYKFAFYFFASKFMVGRFAIYLEPEAGYSTTWSDCYHQIVEVQGDTLYTVTIPYTDARAGSWIATAKVKIVALSIQSNATTTPIYVTVYKAGSSDFQFYCPIEWSVAVPQSNPREVFTKDFKPMHPSMTGYHTKNLIYGDEVTHLKQLLLRLYAYKTHAQNNGLDVFAPPITFTFNNKSYRASVGLEAYSRLFKYYRGSIRMKSTSGKSATTTSRGFIFKRSQGRNQPTIALNNLNDSNVDCIVPYCYPDLMLPTNGVNINKMRAMTTSSGFLFKGAGDDYSLHFLRGLPMNAIRGANGLPPDHGVDAFASYMTIA